MEGVMMKNKDQYAVAVRKPDNEIVVEKSTHKDFSDKVKLFKLPIFRGMLAFVDSMVVGVKVLNFSASFFEDENEAIPEQKKDKSDKTKAAKSKKDPDFEVEEVSVAHNTNDGQKNAKVDQTIKDEKSNALLMVFAVLISILLSVTLFMVLPTYIVELFKLFVKNNIILTLIEGVIRLTIFIGYVLLASLMPEIKRVYMYHGAEHKTINCLENGFELTVENVKWQSKQHKRCGTSFMLFVILISLVFFMILPVNNLFWKVVTRIVLVPFIAGVSYEFIRFAGRSNSRIVDILSKPGLWMQGLTTKEPEDSMIEVAIASVSAVFDWRTFLEDGKSSKETAAVQEKKSKPTPKQIEVVKSQDKPQNMTNKAAGSSYAGRRNANAAPIEFKPAMKSRSEEEDDEILKALDKYLDEGQKGS